MKEKIYVIGHKIPDTDSICAAIAYSHFKRETGTENVYAARLGNINRETEFILRYFGVELPEFISTVKMQVKDFDIDRVIPISPDISIRKAWNIMKKQNVKTLPVINDSGQMVGLCTLSDLTGNLLDVSQNNLFTSSSTSKKNVLETIAGRVINEFEFNFSKTRRIIMFMDINKNDLSDEDIVIVGNDIKLQIDAIKKGALCIIITGSCTVDKDIIGKAFEKQCMLMVSPYDSFTVARLINQSIPVSYVMSKQNIISFDMEDFYDEVKEIMLDTRFRAYPVLDKNQVAGTISRYHLIRGYKKKVILVDHNEWSQSVDGLDQAEVLEVIDHHRIGGIQTTNPVYFVNKPVGSTSTIIANMYYENNIKIPPKIAGILCSAIISDTLLFKSPTSTKTDEMTARQLSDIAGIDMYDFGALIFKAGTSLSGKSAHDIFYQDFKEFNIGKKKVGIGQIITMDREGIGHIRDEIADLMEDIENNKDYEVIILMLTDIINEGSEIIFTRNGRDIVSKAFNKSVGNDSVYLPKVVSRKKQVLPQIAAELGRKFHI